MANEYRRLNDYPRVSFHSLRALLTAVRIRMPKEDVAKMIFLIKECREALGAEGFREIAVESVGEAGATAVEKLLADSEKLRYQPD